MQIKKAPRLPLAIQTRSGGNNRQDAISLGSRFSYVSFSKKLVP